MSKAWARGSTTRWRRLRRAVLLRDHHLCRIGAPGCTTHATHVDHIVSRAMGGTDEESNLRASCESCNLGRKRGTPIEEPPHRRVSRW